MADFMVRFGICNLFLCGIIGILFLARHLFRNIVCPHAISPLVFAAWAFNRSVFTVSSFQISTDYIMVSNSEHLSCF